MKFTLCSYVLIMGSSCFLAASLNNNLFPSSLNAELDDSGISNNITRNLVDMERFPIPWSALNGIFLKVLSSWEGLQCAKEEILKIYDAALLFVSEIRKCKCSTTDSVEELEVTAYNIISNANDIFDINKKLYYYAQNKDKRTFSKYFPALYNKNIELKDEINAGVNIIEIAGEAGICADKATKEFQNILIRFPIGIAKCLLR